MCLRADLLYCTVQYGTLQRSEKRSMNSYTNWLLYNDEAFGPMFLGLSFMARDSELAGVFLMFSAIAAAATNKGISN